MSCVSFLISLSLDAQNTGEHQCAHPCPVCLYLSLRHCGDIQGMSEHISARSCPYSSLFDTMRTHRAQASTVCLLVSCVSLSQFLWMPMSWTSLTLSLQHCGDIQDTSEHISAHLCPYFFLRHLADTQDMSEHTGARLCLVCLIKHVLDIIRNLYIPDCQ